MREKKAAPMGAAFCLPADSREIGRIMNQMAGWERTDQQIPSGEYRGQRYWFKQEQMTVNDFVEV